MKFFFMFVICLLSISLRAQTDGTIVFVAEKMKMESDKIFTSDKIKPLEITITEDEIFVKETGVYIKADAVREYTKDETRTKLFQVYEGTTIQVIIRYDVSNNVASVTLIKVDGTIFTYLNNLLRC